MTTTERSRITDLYENKILTRTERNEYGQWEYVQKEFRHKRPVNDLTIGLRLVNIIIDITVFRILAYIFGEIEFIKGTSKNSR